LLNEIDNNIFKKRKSLRGYSFPKQAVICEAILKVLQKADRPISTSELKKITRYSVKNSLMELLLENKIERIKYGKCWTYRIKK